MSDEYELIQKLCFEAAHSLPHAPEGHKCRRVHGHSYIVETTFAGPLQQPQGWVVDFADIGALLREVRDQLDHRLLNDVPGLDNPTSENLASWLWVQLGDKLAGIRLTEVFVRETCTSACRYRGPTGRG